LPGLSCLGRTEKAIYHLVARRGIPFIKRRWRLMFDRLTLERWMQRGKVDAAARPAHSCSSDETAPQGSQ
jgi:hypothetical protein